MSWFPFWVNLWGGLSGHWHRRQRQWTETGAFRRWSATEKIWRVNKSVRQFFDDINSISGHSLNAHWILLDLTLEYIHFLRSHSHSDAPVSYRNQNTEEGSSKTTYVCNGNWDIWKCFTASPLCDISRLFRNRSRHFILYIPNIFIYPLSSDASVSAWEQLNLGLFIRCSRSLFYVCSNFEMWM